ncbi:MAG: hypothetical protein GX055_01955 [Desulfovibrionales bacterium]|nr:hypothetical protein [Desulfovibrionales bacterium]
MDTALKLYGQEFCVIDTSNLFVCTNIADELLLYSADNSLLAVLTAQCAGLGIALDPRRALHTYSGGEQAMICCALLSLVLPRRPVRVLLVHIVEALSVRNAQKILHLMQANAPQMTILTLTEEGPVAYV